MRSTALAAAIGTIALGACAGRSSSPPFASPTAVSAVPAAAADRRTSDPMPTEDRADAPSAPGASSRVVSAPRVRVVSAADPPRRPARPIGVMTPAPASTPLATAGLRGLVGRRDPRDPLAAVAAWSRELGAPLAATSGAELVSWAREARRLRPATEAPRPGDVLVFDQATGDEPADLVALVLDRDGRGVTEFLYLGAGVVRRGLVDASRPAVHRDDAGATVNTYLRHGKRWPAPGTHYLAGELLAHVVRLR